MGTTSTGLRYPALTDDNAPPVDLQKLAEDVDATYGPNVANAGALPASGKFAGQRIWLTDVKGWAVWNGSTWLTDTAWVQPTLSNSWVSFDGGSVYDIPAYRRVAGITYIKGFAKSGSPSAAIFTLPAGFRPLKQRRFAINASGGALSAIGQITAAGVVSIEGYGTSSTNASVSLEMSFPAEQ